MNDNEGGNVSIAPIAKKYDKFGEFLKDAAAGFYGIEDGVLIVFDDLGHIRIMPVCGYAQMALVAADLLQLVAGRD